MKYICSVYSYTSRLTQHSKITLLHDRYKFISEVTANYLKNNETVFSPIAHCHPISKTYDMPKTWDFWENHDKKYIDASSSVIVAKMPFWKLSTGVTGEIKHAKATDKHVEYLELSEMQQVSLSPFINMDLPLSPLQQLKLLEFSEFLLTLDEENYNPDVDMHTIKDHSDSSMPISAPFEVHDYMILKKKEDVVASGLEWVAYFFDCMDDDYDLMTERLFGFNELTVLDALHFTFFAPEWDDFEDTPLKLSNRIVYFLHSGNCIDGCYDSNSLSDTYDMQRDCTKYQQQADKFVESLEIE